MRYAVRMKICEVSCNLEGAWLVQIVKAPPVRTNGDQSDNNFVFQS